MGNFFDSFLTQRRKKSKNQPHSLSTALHINQSTTLDGVEQIGRWRSEKTRSEEDSPSLRQEKSELSQPLLRKKTNQALQ